MVKRKSLRNDPCPIARSIDVIGDRWALLIIRDAFSGAKRFGEFQKNLGVAKNILSTRLRDLVDDGILDMVPASDGSVYHEYVLTRKGRELFAVVLGLRQWGEGHLFGQDETCSSLVERKTGRLVPRIKPHACDGKLLKPEDIVVRKKHGR